jgi:hypothetical protein
MMVCLRMRLLRTRHKMLELGQIPDSTQIGVREQLFRPPEAGIKALPENGQYLVRTIIAAQHAHSPVGGARRLLGEATGMLLDQLQCIRVFPLLI